MATKKSYTKPHLSTSSQIQQLKSRGMLFKDDVQAEHYLSHINYYRLTAYWLPYEENHTSHQFKLDTYFERILDDYIFDRELRLLLLDAIERIEVSIRTKMAYSLTKTYGSHPHLNPSIFQCPIKYAQNLTKLKNEYERNNDTFSKHFKDTYKEKIPPMWVAVELTTLGQTSHWFSNIKKRSDRKCIAAYYNIDESILKSYLHHLTIIRNICAHHSRLWNKKFTFSSKIPRNPENLAQSLIPDMKTIYNTLVFIKFFMDTINPSHSWHKQLISIIEKYQINTTSMGFPNNWKDKPIWKKEES